MGLLEALTEETSRPTKCAIRDILSAVSEEERIALLEAIEKVRFDARPSVSRVYSYSWLAGVLTNNGYTVSRTTVSRHTTRKCGCE
jgi:hypothetical protein